MVLVSKFGVFVFVGLCAYLFAFQRTSQNMLINLKYALRICASTAYLRPLSEA
jgi:hypothetical protein